MDRERRPVDYSYVITQGTFLIGNWGNNLIADTIWNDNAAARLGL